MEVSGRVDVVGEVNVGGFGGLLAGGKLVGGNLVQLGLEVGDLVPITGKLAEVVHHSKIVGMGVGLGYGLMKEVEGLV